MYEFLDRPVTGLDHGGRFLVWSMRTWVSASGERICPANRLAPAFCHWRMLTGLQPFLRVMTLLNRHGLENFQFCALRCNHVSEHEAILLSLACALDDDAPERVKATVALLIDEPAIGDLIASLSALKQAMAAAGIAPERHHAAQPSASPYLP